MFIYGIGILTGIALTLSINAIFAHDTGNIAGFIIVTLLLAVLGVFLVDKQRKKAEAK